MRKIIYRKNLAGFYIACTLLVLAVFFVFNFKAKAKQQGIVINEIMIGEKSNTKNEFIELFNPTNKPIMLNGYKLTKKTASGSESNLVSNAKFLGTIGPREYFVIAPLEYGEMIKADLVYSGTTYSIASNNAILLYDSEENLLDKVGYGSANDFEEIAALNPTDGESIGRIEAKDSDNNSEDFLH